MVNVISKRRTANLEKPNGSLFSLFLVFFSLTLNAQVPVHEEPRHRPVFKNNKVRILNVLLPPADTTMYHIHSTPSIFITFSTTSTTSQLQNQQPVTGNSASGTIWYEDLGSPHTKIHRVWNTDVDTFRVMDIELLYKDSGFLSTPSTFKNAILVIDTPYARVYKLNLEGSQSIRLEKHKNPFVVVAIDGGTIKATGKMGTKNLAVKPSTFFWVEPNERTTFQNLGENTVRFALVETR